MTNLSVARPAVKLLLGGAIDGADVYVVECGQALDPLKSKSILAKGAMTVLKKGGSRMIVRGLTATVLPGLPATLCDLVVVPRKDMEVAYYKLEVPKTNQIENALATHWAAASDVQQAKTEILPLLANDLNQHRKAFVQIVNGNLVVWQETWDPMFGSPKQTAEQIVSKVDFSRELFRRLNRVAGA